MATSVYAKQMPGSKKLSKIILKRIMCMKGGVGN